CVGEPAEPNLIRDAVVDPVHHPVEGAVGLELRVVPADELLRAVVADAALGLEARAALLGLGVADRVHDPAGAARSARAPRSGHAACATLAARGHDGAAAAHGGAGGAAAARRRDVTVG